MKPAKRTVYPHTATLADIPPQFRGIRWDEWFDLVTFTEENRSTGGRQPVIPYGSARDRYGMKGAIPYRNNTRHK